MEGWMQEAPAVAALAGVAEVEAPVAPRAQARAREPAPASAQVPAAAAAMPRVAVAWQTCANNISFTAQTARG